METIALNEKTYTVIRLLGKGKGGYSYLVTDGAGEYVLKQIHHEPCDYYQFGDKLASELRDYQRLKDVGIPMPALLEADETRERILKEYIAGDTLDKLVKEDRMRDSYFRQMEQICHVLYAAGLNIDYFPTNFVVREEKLYYIDFECNPYEQQWDFQHWGSRYWWKSEEFIKHFGEDAQ